jgi:hypothetical protein
VRWLHTEPRLTIHGWERLLSESSFSVLLKLGENLVNAMVDVSKAN